MDLGYPCIEVFKKCPHVSRILKDNLRIKWFQGSVSDFHPLWNIELGAGNRPIPRESFQRRSDGPGIESDKVYERCRSYDLTSKAFGLEDVGKALEYSLKTVHAIQVGVSVEKFISQKVSLSH